MARQVTAQIRLQVPGGSATPAPPVGPALGQHGVNIGEFVKRFNEATQSMRGTMIPVIISIYSDRSFDFITKSPPAAELLKQAAGIAKGSATPHTDKVGKVTKKASSLKKKGRVLAQSPKAGKKLVNGTKVKLTVGKGP